MGRLDKEKFPPVNTLKKVQTVQMEAHSQGYLPITMHSLVMTANLCFQVREGPHWLTWLTFRSSHHHTSFNSRICFPYTCFITANYFNIFQVQRRLGNEEMGSRLYHFIGGGKAHGLTGVPKTSASGIFVNRSPCKGGNWVAVGVLK